MSTKLASDGWALISAEDRNAAYPNTFQIPARKEREALAAGDAAKLLFDIETREKGRLIDRGVDRMWVIVKVRIEGGDVIAFGPEHIADISTPPRDYVLEKYGASFFD